MKENLNLLRKPRRPKQLPKITIEVKKNFNENDNESDISIQTSGKNTPSTDREFISSSLYLASQLQKPFSFSNRITPKIQNNEFTGKHVNSLAYMSSISNDQLEGEDEFNEFDGQKTNSLNTFQNTQTIQKDHQIGKINQTKEHFKQTVQREYSQFIQNPLIKPYKPLGPDPLPPRKPRHQDNKTLYYQGLTYDSKLQENQFIFNDFLLDSISAETNLIVEDIKEKVLSKQNYVKYCKMLEDKIRLENKNRDKLHVQTLEPNIEPFENRVPLRQIIIEMANFLKKELSATMGINLKAKFNPLPKWQKLQGSHTEIVVYEDLNMNNSNYHFLTFRFHDQVN